jgi:hypothetical protein
MQPGWGSWPGRRSALPRECCSHAGDPSSHDRERSGPDVSSGAGPSPRLVRTGLPLAILPKYGLQINAIW